MPDNLDKIDSAHSSKATSEESKPSIPVPDSVMRQIARTILSNTIVLGCDYLATSMPFGMALKAEALVQKPTWRDLLKRKEWKDSYKRTWGVLKYGFYPTFLLEVAVSEAAKRTRSPMLASYSDLIIPTLISAGTAPASSIVAINTRYKLQLDLLQLYRQKGLSGVTKLTGGPISVGIREGLCFYALHHKTSDFAQRIADNSAQYQSVSSLYRKSDGNPTWVSKLLATSSDGLAMLAAQPLTIFAANAATFKYQLQQQPDLMPKKPKLTSPLALIRWQLNFARYVCHNIVEEGKKTGLSPFKSFAPGVVVRTGSLLGTLTVFKYCLDPVTQAVSENITHRRRLNI